MARLIVKSPYFKGGGAKPAGGYLRYIATRERVEILPDDRPPTKRQTQLIEKLTKDFPDTKTLLEYGDYTAHPTKFNATQFLTLAMEENWGKVQEIDGYAKYIATRPRAERLGEHGLFGDEDAVDQNAAMAEVNSYSGNIWTHIISLRRDFHAHPEISLKEYRTAQRIEEELDKLGIPHQRSGETGAEKICGENLQVLSDRMLEALRGVSLSVHAGEILGAAAIVGNGQSELVEAITGMRPVRGGSVQDGQYLDYVYRIHKVRFAQVFRADLEELGITAEEALGEDYVPRSAIFDMTSALSDTDDTVQVLEHWFRQPVETTVNGETIPAGAVACSIQAGGHELRYIPHYWRRTGAQNTLFPFVHYWRIQDENQFWNKSELTPVLDLVDAADRKLAAALLNDSFLSNDILLVEDGALADGEELTNEPGAIVHLKQGRMGAVQRLGGLQSVGKAAMDITWFKEQIERASRSYDTGTGKETARVTTALGLSMLRADGREQSDIKRADRNAGFERLYELLDWLSLEFFDDDRMLYLGAPEGTRAPGQRMIYNSADFARTLPEVRSLTGEVVRPLREFFPRVDITVQAADGARRDRQTTLQALDSLTRSNVTAENWRIFAAELEILDIPDR